MSYGREKMELSNAFRPTVSDFKAYISISGTPVP
jgi:hypothetical protein